MFVLVYLGLFAAGCIGLAHVSHAHLPYAVGAFIAANALLAVVYGVVSGDRFHR